MVKRNITLDLELVKKNCFHSYPKRSSGINKDSKEFLGFLAMRRKDSVKLEKRIPE